MSDIGVVIVAAGTGSRARNQSGELKQFRWIAGKPMLLHSIQSFHSRPDVGMVVCVLPRDRVGDPPPWIFQCDLDRLLLSVGGDERGDSVRNGLEDLPAELPFVLVHDAARPLVPADMIDRVIRGVRSGAVTVPALPVVDTIKESDGGDTVVRTLDRRNLHRIQTPQGFPREILIEAHMAALRDRLSATDDAALCEAIGAKVLLVPGSEVAMKVTSEADFAIAEALAAAGRDQS
jgi:2-C-methyl-D-erythritol 4-phosphate cytidylyltransferase